MSVIPDWSGRLVFVTEQGVVGRDPTRRAATVRTLDLGERITNSIAVDETGGVYVVDRRRRSTGSTCPRPAGRR